MIRVIEKALTRLSVPALLDKKERAALDQLLTPDELDDLFKRYVEIRDGRSFMTMPLKYTEEYIDTYYELEGYWVDLWWIKRWYRSQLRRLEKAQAVGDDVRIKSHTAQALSYAQQMRGKYDALSDSAKRRLFPPTIHSVDQTQFDDPRGIYLTVWPEQFERGKGQDLSFWPNHPTTWQEAYIEVLTAKLEGIKKALPSNL